MAGVSRVRRAQAPAASRAQAGLESFVLEQLDTSPSLCAHPFGIASLTSATTSLTLHLDPYMGQERYSSLTMRARGAS
ncbi:hypothetical protein OG288_43940 [Streptomyces tauricus]|uniref:Uncharacterized protein n=1 Tax=Streptomyces tauricus TaxID=68274 RepID=A0ABZ1JUM8_9ACTN|nr:hypothetical protein [Streptomyces tauricus]MCW8103407.1 hypothetical protein [Streptomyces tauricus]